MANNGPNLGWLGGVVGGAGSLIGAGVDSWTQQKINKENYEMQKEFAQNSLQWKIADAKKAGIHPLVAVGAQTYSASPSSVASGSGKSIGRGFEKFGQAIDTYIADDEEKRGKENEMLQLQIEEQRLRNAKLQKELETFGQNVGGIADVYGAGSRSDTASSLFQQKPKTWLSNALGKERAIHLEQQAGQGRATYLPNPNSFTGQSANESIVSRWLTHAGNYSDLAFTDLMFDIRKEAYRSGLPKDKSLIWYPGIDGPVIMEVDKSTAETFDTFTSWLKKFNPTKNYFTNGDFISDLKSFFRGNRKGYENYRDRVSNFNKRYQK